MRNNRADPSCTGRKLVAFAHDTNRLDAHFEESLVRRLRTDCCCSPDPRMESYVRVHPRQLYRIPAPLLGRHQGHRCVPNYDGRHTHAGRVYGHPDGDRSSTVGCPIRMALHTRCVFYRSIGGVPAVLDRSRTTDGVCRCAGCQDVRLGLARPVVHRLDSAIAMGGFQLEAASVAVASHPVEPVTGRRPAPARWRGWPVHMARHRPRR